MTRTVLRRAGLVVSALASLASLASAQRRPINRTTLAGPNPTTPSLIVFITVDQMRADYFPRFASQLTGGLGRLYRGGAVFTNAYQDHAITETAPGHSVTMSGRFPAHTGIVMNAQGVPDAQAPLVGGGGPGASPYRFRGSTLIDWLRIKDARSRALSVSRKDRGAILPLGRAHQDVFWYASDGRFTTSTYYADTLPSWVQTFNARRIPQSYAGRRWDLLLPASAYPERDSVPNENNGRDYTFPHAFPEDAAQTARTFTEYPQMDSITAQLALAGVDAMHLGTGPQTDVLAVSFSTTDAIGHRYGPESRELHDQILRLDRYVGEMIDSLYRMRDSAGIVFALTADHGVAPYPELHAEETHTTALRPDITPVIRAAQDRLAAAGVPRQALRFEEGIIHVARDTVAQAGLEPDSIVRALAAALRKVKGIARVDRPADLARADTVRDAVARRWVHMIPSDYPADLVVSIAPYAYYANVRTATHGSPNDYDAHVPEIYYGPWFKPGHYAQHALVADMAPTLAAVAKVKPTEKLDGRARTEAIARP
ncbi:MAG TPA: alkaline phosphatase family protein [Gemmatimonadaceae bacterium]|nr:alkaline phosphatase family protein [Gemmatimonadaceae bacterium]